MTEALQLTNRSFVLTDGGPTYRIERRLGLLREDSSRIMRRAACSILVTWVPLFLLAALQGVARGEHVSVPFLRDFAIHARFLVAVPLLLCAEVLLGPKFARAAGHFVDSGLVKDQDYPRFDSAINCGLKWRDSTLAEVVLIVLAYAVTATALPAMAIHVSTWYALRSDQGISLTWAGWWFVLFCVPLFQFLTLRWIWRQFLWAQFLWRMSRLDLQLMPIHPDNAAGVGFVGEAQRSFAVVLLAYSFAVAGVLANGVLYDKAPLPHFAVAIAGYVIVAVLIALIPVVTFFPVLRKAKRSGLYEYGILATAYTLSFHKKWILGVNPQHEALLGTEDIQSLASLGNSFDFVERMNPLPIGPRTPIHLALACVIPMSPLLLTVIPMKEVLRMVLKFVL